MPDYPNPTGYTNKRGYEDYDGCIGCKWRSEDGWRHIGNTDQHCNTINWPEHTNKPSKINLDWPENV